MKRYPTLKDVLAQRAARRAAGPRRGMNKVEAHFAWSLKARMLRGEILDWKYESIKLRLGGRCWYCPDFAVKHLDGSIELIECKAIWRVHGKDRPGYRDDARVKVRVSAEQFGGFFKLSGAYRRRDGGWETEAF